MECLPIVISAAPAGAAAQPIFTRDRQALFIAALAEGGAARLAAARAGVSHATAYRERRASPEFRLAWDAALLAARVHAEEVLASRALDGVEEEVFYHGEVVASRRRYDSRLLLAHLGRLDRLTADARTEAFADDFEAALARFSRGEEPVPDAAGAAGAEATDGEGGFLAPGQCNKCHTAEADEAAIEAVGEPPCSECGGRCLDPEAALTSADCRWLGNRLARMDAARPRGARKPHEFTGHDTDAVESVQLAAFEAGVAQWWRMIPRGDDAPRAARRRGWVRASDALFP